MLVFTARKSRFRGNNHQKKKPGNKHEQMPLFWSNVPEKPLKWGPEIHPESRNIKVWTPKCFLLCSQEPHNRPEVPKKAAPALPKDRFGYQECQYLFPNIIRITSLKAMSDRQRPAADGATHKIIN